MRPHIRSVICSLMFFCVFLAGGPVEASPAGDALRAKLVNLGRIKPDSPELGSAIDGIAAYQALAARCLEDLPRLKPAERAEFKVLLVDLARASLRRQFLRVRGAEVKWGVEMRDGDGYVAKSVVKSSSNSFDVDWVLVREGEDWRLVDVVTEGASMVKTWRRGFKSTFDRGGWPALAKKMRSAAEKAEATRGD